MSVLKRLAPQTLRMGEATGIGVLIADDCAVVNFEQWYGL